MAENAFLHIAAYGLLNLWGDKNPQFGEMMIMDTLNKDSLVKHINNKITNYKQRQETAKSEGKSQEATDYELRIMPLNNLLIRIVRGEFDHISIKPQEKEVKEQQTVTGNVETQEENK